MILHISHSEYNFSYKFDNTVGSWETVLRYPDNIIFIYPDINIL